MSPASRIEAGAPLSGKEKAASFTEDVKDAAPRMERGVEWGYLVSAVGP